MKRLSINILIAVGLCLGTYTASRALLPKNYSIDKIPTEVLYATSAGLIGCILLLLGLSGLIAISLSSFNKGRLDRGKFKLRPFIGFFCFAVVGFFMCTFYWAWLNSILS